MDLHYSQTDHGRFQPEAEFESPMDLHYSQTARYEVMLFDMFESPMDLHYSQTCFRHKQEVMSLNPLWIYTTLKQCLMRLI